MNKSKRNSAKKPDTVLIGILDKGNRIEVKKCN